MSLLKKALATSASRHAKNSITEDDIEIALEWARGNISLTQMKAAYESERGKPLYSTSNLYVTIAMALRAYILKNKI